MRCRAWGLVAAIGLLSFVTLVALARGQEFDLGAQPQPEAFDEYYLAIFSSQGNPKVPNRTHNWGVAVHVQIVGEHREVVSYDAISWMPRTLEINMLRLRVEQGVNLSHEQSVAIAARTGQRVSLWGVYLISSDSYLRFQNQRARLISGQLGYQCLDTIGEAGNRRNGVNCVHALADFASLMPKVPVAAQPYGDESAAVMAQALVRRGLVGNPYADVSWVIEAMQWNAPQIAHRRQKFEPTASNAIVTSD